MIKTACTRIVKKAHTKLTGMCKRKQSQAETQK